MDNIKGLEIAAKLKAVADRADDLALAVDAACASKLPAKTEQDYYTIPQYLDVVLNCMNIAILALEQAVIYSDHNKDVKQV